MKQFFFYFWILLFFIGILSDVSGDENLPFDPGQVAKEETAAWKDYYDNDIAGLTQHLSQLVIIEFRLNQISAWTTVVPQLMAAATTFKNLPQDSTQKVYESQVLPHLVAAYQEIREALKGSWDPKQAAKKELEWWIYRRKEKTANPELVGKKISQLYQLIYGHKDQGHFTRAGYLRAVAARYRDLCHHTGHPLEESDWAIVESILYLSYHELLIGIQANVNVQGV